MGSKMLVDASHPEETRVVVARGNRIEEFDFESASRKPLKGNIYLAKVTRVEPSLQAAFVEYGGNRHGFLAFAEIHPDYYQIPVADRLALLKEQEEDDAEDQDDDDDHGDARPAPQADNHDDHHDDDHDAEHADDQNGGDHHDDDHHDHVHHEEDHGTDEVEASVSSDEEPAAQPLAAEAMPAVHGNVSDEPSSEGDSHSDDEHASDDHGSDDHAGEGPSGDLTTVDEDAESRAVESVGAEDALEEVPQRRQQRRPRRRVYKIQEVIKRRQILLVQVVKEERGNKGAALTTYLSLAGRYCVLMPNTARGGGISRKITDAGDRRRLKEVARDVEVPQGMGLIVRTAGAQRTRPEIKRDFDYLIRLWESVRDLTLQSQAPSLVYEEGSLIKRSIRDLYTKDVDEVIVEGVEAFREAKDFMKMLMPSHAKNVKLYSENKPLFTRHGVESHLDALFSPSVTLPSGGYLVINQTEALVAIDINSGKATREHNIEDTATKTNLEACDEIARQLRLRDLAGLVVIDFIDMEENRNNRAVERRMKDALKNDRARIQVGRISHFGLLEMSRQRLRPGLIEGTFHTCAHCEGRGIVRSVSSCGLGVLRSIEDHLLKREENLTVKCARDVAFYLLNEKRDNLLAIEQAHGVTIFIVPNDDVKGTSAQIEKAHDRNIAPRRLPTSAPVRMDSAFEDDPVTEEQEAADEAATDEENGSAEGEGASEENGEGQAERSREGGRRRRRRGRRGGRRDGQPNGENGASAEGAEGEQDDERPAQAFEAQIESVDDGENGDDGVETVSGEDGAEGGEREARGDDDGRRDRKGRRSRFGRGRGRGRDRERGERPEGTTPEAGETAEPSGDDAAAAPEVSDAGEDAPRDQESRDQGQRRERGPRRERGGRGERGERRDRGDRPERGERPERASEPVYTAPPVVKIDIPDHIPDPEPRKWTPPTPTVAAEPAARKAGWWSKRKDG